MSDGDGRPPSFQFFVRDFLTSRSVSLMGLDAVGGYVMLLCHAWLSDEPGTLPDDDEVLAGLSRLGDRWPACAPSIRRAFKAAEMGGERVLIQPRMRQEREAQIRRRRSASAGAESTNRKRWGKEGKVAQRSLELSLGESRTIGLASASASAIEPKTPGPGRGPVPLEGPIGRIMGHLGIPPQDAEARPGSPETPPPAQGTGVHVQNALDATGWTGDPQVRTAAQIANKLKKVGASQRTVEAVLLHFRDHRGRITSSPFAYYHPGAPGFESLRESLCSRMAEAEGADHKALERLFLEAMK